MVLWFCEFTLPSLRFHAFQTRALLSLAGLSLRCSEGFSLLVTFLLVTFSWLFRGFSVALICLEKQCLGFFFGRFSWLFRGFSVAFPWPSFWANLTKDPSKPLQNAFKNPSETLQRPLQGPLQRHLHKPFRNPSGARRFGSRK